MGTDPYMAPEVVTSKDYGPPADVYSFGVTIWEIIHRKHPSEHLVISKDPVGNDFVELSIDPNKMEEETSEFLKRCWQRDVSARPSIGKIGDFLSRSFQTILVTTLISKTDRKMFVLNKKTFTWIELQLELCPESGVVCLHGELYLIGSGPNRKDLLKLDKNMEWKRLAEMNERRRYIKNTCLGWNGYIWVFGGRDRDNRDSIIAINGFPYYNVPWN